MLVVVLPVNRKPRVGTEVSMISEPFSTTGQQCFQPTNQLGHFVTRDLMWPPPNPLPWECLLIFPHHPFQGEPGLEGDSGPAGPDGLKVSVLLL